MKNARPRTAQPSDGLARGACGRFDRDLRRRGVAERPAAPTASTSASSRLGSRAGVEPDGGRLPRSCAATPPRCRSAAPSPRTVARKLASIRAFYRSLVEHGEIDAEPRRPAARAQAAAAAAAGAASRTRSRALLDRIPASTPLELRDRALFELAYSCGLRAEELVDLDVESIDFDAEECASRARAPRRASSPRASPRCARSRATSSRARPALARRRRRAGAVPLQDRPAPVDLGRAPPPARLGAPRRAVRRGLTRTPCGTPSPPTCSRAAPTCAPSRSCSATQPSRRPRSTLG